MRHCLIFCGLVLAACGRDPVPAIAALDLTPCPGWLGPRPATEGHLIRAAAAEQAGRLCANAKLAAAAAVTTPK